MKKIFLSIYTFIINPLLLICQILTNMVTKITIKERNQHFIIAELYHSVA